MWAELLTVSLDNDVKTVLAADTTLQGIFSTRILTYADLGDLGLNRNGYPAAFDSTGEILPTMIIRDRAQNTTLAMTDEGQQIRSYVQACEVVVYNSRFNGYADLDTALTRVYTLLHDRNAGKARLTLRQNVTNEREPLLNFAAMQYSIYDAIGLLKP